MCKISFGTDRNKTKSIVSLSDPVVGILPRMLFRRNTIACSIIVEIVFALRCFDLIVTKVGFYRSRSSSSLGLVVHHVCWTVM